MSRQDELLKKQREKSISDLKKTLKAFGAHVLEYHNGARKDFCADAYSKKGWVWKETGSHVISVNDLPKTLGRETMTGLMLKGIEKCERDLCGYCV